MRLNVLQLTLKVQRYHPRIVCFVGKKIWDIYESVVKRAVVAGGSGESGQSQSHLFPVETIPQAKFEYDDDVKQGGREDADVQGPALTSKLTQRRARDETVLAKVEEEDPSTAHRNATTEHPAYVELSKPPTPVSATRQRLAKNKPVKFDWTRPRPFRLPSAEGEDEYTYFWVVPNTSGLERTPVSCSALITPKS
jgi:hypothetical protein